MADPFTSLASGYCPDCGGHQFLFGPRGAAARNYGCAGCGSWFNLTIWKGRLVLGFIQRLEPGRRPNHDSLEIGPLPIVGGSA